MTQVPRAERVSRYDSPDHSRSRVKGSLRCRSSQQVNSSRLLRPYLAEILRLRYSASRPAPLALPTMTNDEEWNANLSFQSRREIGQHRAVLARAERAAGGGEAAVENAVVSARLQEDQRRDTFPRGRVQAGLVLLPIGEPIDRKLCCRKLQLHCQFFCQLIATLLLEEGSTRFSLFLSCCRRDSLYNSQFVPTTFTSV